jgi:hypothetical protein
LKKPSLDTIVLVAFTFLLTVHGVLAQEVPPAYRRFFAQYTTVRSSLWEQVLRPLGVSTSDVGRSFALIAIVSKYPQMRGMPTTLPPAQVDGDRLVKEFRDRQKFDEVVILRNEDVTPENLRYFLRDYFKQHLRDKGRFVFAYSGHGFTNDQRTKSYVLLTTAESMSDSTHSIGIRELKDWVDEVVDNAHQCLVLINACYGGTFVDRSAFGPNGVPRNPGAFAITASTSSQLAFADSSVGAGSLFFEAFLAGLSGKADTFPIHGKSVGDGIITFTELYAYITLEVGRLSGEAQRPAMGDLMPHGKPSPGTPFFIVPGAKIETDSLLSRVTSAVKFGDEPTRDMADYHRGLTVAFQNALDKDRAQAPTTVEKAALWQGLLKTFDLDAPERADDARLLEVAKWRAKYWQLVSDGASEETIVNLAAEAFVNMIDRQYLEEAYDRFSSTGKQQETAQQFRQRMTTYIASRGGVPSSRTCFVNPRPVIPMPKAVRSVRCEVHLANVLMVEDLALEATPAGWGISSFYTSPGEVYR